MKRILFLYDKRYTTHKNAKLHLEWHKYLKDEFVVQYWGKNFKNEFTQEGLDKMIDKFKPDYIYCTIRTRYRKWPIYFNKIQIPKIFISVDSYKYKRSHRWYKNFDQVYTRPVVGTGKSWITTPVFMWSIPEQQIQRVDPKLRIRDIGFSGTGKSHVYPIRQAIADVGIRNTPINNPKEYWNYLRSHRALVCPTESSVGDFLPGKFFEYLAAGAAVITNINLEKYGLEEFDDKVIRYKSLNDLRTIAKMDFEPYYEKAFDLLRAKYIDRVRYKELFK